MSDEKIEATDTAAEPKKGKPAPKGEAGTHDVMAELALVREDMKKMGARMDYLKNQNKALQEEVEALKSAKAPEPVKPTETRDEEPDQDITQLSARVERVGDTVGHLTDELERMGQTFEGAQQFLLEEGSKIARSANEWYGHTFEMVEAVQAELGKINAQLDRKAKAPKAEGRAPRQAIDA